MEVLSIAFLVTTAVYLRRLWQRDWDILHLHRINLSSPENYAPDYARRPSPQDDEDPAAAAVGGSCINDRINQGSGSVPQLQPFGEPVGRNRQLSSSSSSDSISSRIYSTCPEEPGPCHISRLSPELILMIMSYLELPDLCRLALVSKQWAMLSRDGSLYGKVVAKKEMTMVVIGRLLSNAGSFCDVIDLSRLEGLSAIRWLALATSKLSHCKRVTSLILKFNEDFVKCESPFDPLSSLSALTYLSLEESGGLLDKHMALLGPLRGLKSLSLKNCSRITDIGISFVASSLKKLESLDLTGCHLVTINGFESLSKTESPLKALTLKDCRNLRNESLELFSHFPLEELNVANCRRLTDEGFEKLLPSLPNIRTLNISGCSQVTDVTLALLGTVNLQLRSINCSSCNLITDTGAADLFSSILPLQYVNFSSCQLFRGNSFANKNLVNLRVLDLSSVKISRTAVSDLGFSAPNLVQLSITNNPMVSDAGVISISKSCMNLRRLDLSGCGFVGNMALDALSRCKPSKLEVLSLICCHGVSDDGVLSLSLGCLKLRVLNVSNCPKITDISLAHLKILKRLRKLDLYLCKAVSQKAIRRLMRVNPHLTIDC